MNALLLLLASLCGAATPAHRDGLPTPLDPVGVTVAFAQAIHLETAVPYPWVAGRPVRADGWLIELRVDPALLVPRQVGSPVFYVGGTPVAIVNADARGGCAVGYALGAPDPATSPVYAGSAELPERIDAAAGQREQDAAVARGATVRAPGAVAPPLVVADLAALYGLLADRVAACAPHEIDRIAVLRAQAAP